MDKELQDKLYKNYPKIFKQKDLPSTETCMCWGITCGDGWYNILDSLCQTIKNRVNSVNNRIDLEIQNKKPTLVPFNTQKKMYCEAAQVKEKYGSLRFYIDGGDVYIRGAIAMAESLSKVVCELCGNIKKLDNNKQIKVRCEKCRKN